MFLPESQQVLLELRNVHRLLKCTAVVHSAIGADASQESSVLCLQQLLIECDILPEATPLVSDQLLRGEHCLIDEDDH